MYLDPDRLAAIVGDGGRTPGRTVPLRRADLPPQIERLDALATLFLVTVERGRAIVVATLVDPATTGDLVGDATLHDLDITDLLVRLGCERVWKVPVWAATPRIVPPNDADLLRYSLGLPLDAAIEDQLSSAAIIIPRVVDEDFDAEVLRCKVFENPASDSRRRAYAARLRELDDPRGELIDLQLERMKQGSEPTPRERELLATVGDACVGPLRAHLVSYELSRGFLARCVVVPDIRRVAGIEDDLAWSTVVDIATTDDRLLAGKRMLSARIARTDARTLAALSDSDGLLPYETLLAYPVQARFPDDEPVRGIRLNPVDPSEWQRFLDGYAFMRLRAMQIDGRSLGARVGQFLESRLGRRLGHLDAWIDRSELGEWRRAFDRAQLPMLTLRFETGVAALERTDASHRLTLQLARPEQAAAETAALREALGSDLRDGVVQDTNDPNRTRLVL